MIIMIAGIVLYNPNLNRLRENISKILPQVEELLLVDNKSLNFCDVQKVYSKINKIKIIPFEENKGIAYAHNYICQYAYENKHEWVVILDQDSVVCKDIIESYNNIVNDNTIGLISPKIIDRNLDEKIEESPYIFDRNKIQDIKLCIASGSAIRISAWKYVGGFCNEMFIDSVDFDFCFLLKENGYRVVLDNNVFILHEVGHSSIVNHFGKKWQILNHTPLRYYYIIRNTLYLGRRHNCFFINFKMALRIWYTTNLFESDRLEKNKMIIKGFYHGLIGKYGKYN